MTEEQGGMGQQNPQSDQSFNQPVNHGNAFPPPGGNFGGFGGMQQALPNATAVLVLGILSIVSCCCFYGLVSVVLAIIAIVLSKKDKNLYNSNPAMYTESSLKNLNAGRICAIIGLVLSILVVLACIVFIAMFGIGILSDQEAMKEILMEMQRR
jgi:type IV secretory pathway VirB3-like protein